MRLDGAKDYQSYSRKILKVYRKPIFFEMFSDDYNSLTIDCKNFLNR